MTHCEEGASGPIRLVALGGLGEFGLNAMALEWQDDLLLLDAGMLFPPADLPGVDSIVPDFEYLAERKDRVRGILLTHGHEDEAGERDARPALLLALDRVQDPRNLGAILRTAEATGVHGVIVTKHHAAGLTPAVARSAVGGLEHATRELTEIAEIMRRGLSSAAPMGIVLMGPPGTGKSYLAECFARECGMLCVRFRPLRQMYVGQSERNEEKAFAAIRALAPVVVIVDESDQAEGGSRDQGSGDSGVTERMRAAAFNFWGDSSRRGKVLRIDITNRIGLRSTRPCGAPGAPT